MTVCSSHDSPLILLIVYLVVLGTGYWLKYLNLSHLRNHGRTVPPEFEDTVDPVLLKKSPIIR